MEEKVISYILGELSEQEQLRFESECFADEEKFNLLRAARADLIDDYVAGNLSADQRKRLEQHLDKFPEQIMYLDFAEALTVYISKREGAIHKNQR